MKKKICNNKYIFKVIFWRHEDFFLEGKNCIVVYSLRNNRQVTNCNYLPNNEHFLASRKRDKILYALNSLGAVKGLLHTSQCENLKTRK